MIKKREFTRSKLDLQCRGTVVVNLEESREKDQPVSATLAAAIFPFSFVSFTSRENLLSICPPFCSSGPLSVRVPLMGFLFLSPSLSLFLSSFSRPQRVEKGRPSRKYSSFFVARALDVPTTTRWGHGSLSAVPRCYEMACRPFFFLFMTLFLRDIYFRFSTCAFSSSVNFHRPLFPYANRRSAKVTRFNTDDVSA